MLSKSLGLHQVVMGVDCRFKSHPKSVLSMLIHGGDVLTGFSSKLSLYSLMVFGAPIPAIPHVHSA